MSKYQNGKIYKLVDNTNGDVYIGSTITTLAHRLTVHKLKTNLCVSKIIIQNGDYTMVLIESYPCNNKNELLMRERHWIENTICINKTPPIKTKEETILQIKQYRETNREHILKMKCQHYHLNRERILEEQKKPYTCECGSTIQCGEKARHNKSKRHNTYIESLAVKK